MFSRGILNTGTGKHNLKDTLTAELRNTTSPYAVVSTVKAVIDSVSFTGYFSFPHVNPGSYCLTVEGRNSLETWSASGITIANSSSTSYDFSTAAVKAYGSNLVLKGGKYCIYSGDVNNDGAINGTDDIAVTNDANNFVSGYVDTDVNGDYVVNLTDQVITHNNVVAFVSIRRPYNYLIFEEFII